MKESEILALVITIRTALTLLLDCKSAPSGSESVVVVVDGLGSVVQSARWRM